MSLRKSRLEETSTRLQTRLPDFPMNQTRFKLSSVNTQPRRSGLTKKAYKGPSLHRKFDAPAAQTRTTMPTKYAPNKSKPPPKEKDELAKGILSGRGSGSDEDIERLPESSDDEDNAPPPIKATVFKKCSAQGIKSPARITGTETVVGKNKAGQRNSRPTRGNMSPSSSASSSSQKRKTVEGAGTVIDDFGNLKSNKKKPKFFYGSQRSDGSKASSQKTSTQSSRDSPMKALKEPENIGSSPGVDSSFDSPLKKGLEIYGSLPPSSAESTPTKPYFIKHDAEGLETPEKKSTFKSYDIDLDSDDDEMPLPDPASSLVSLPRRSAPEETPATQTAGLKTYDLSDLSQVADLPEGVLEKIAAIASSNRATSRHEVSPALDDDESPVKAQIPRCPMCNEPVDAADLKAKGFMNTRQQEMFCRMHRKKSATEEWTVKGYPEINWDQLDARVSKHHSFIRNIIKGADSHYRAILQDKVDQGKDRNFRKMTSNLTPGYYGSRGLRTVSETIMAKFTPLLKKQMVLDPLMSARGFTPFVQSVVVPEVTVLLIREDMGVDIEEARTILADSAVLGELLNEEVREIVTRQVDDSEDDEDEDEE